MEYTKNYHLPQWAEEDRILMEDFNAMCGAIESGITGAKNSADSAQGAVAELQRTGVGAGGKNARILWGSYTGSGAYGAESPNTIECPFCPVLVLFGCERRVGSGVWPAILMRGCPTAANDCNSSYPLTVTWRDNGVSWYNAEHQDYQGAVKGQVYYYVVVGYDLNT